jgi:hypothetical protein
LTVSLCIEQTKQNIGRVSAHKHQQKEQHQMIEHIVTILDTPFAAYPIWLVVTVFAAWYAGGGTISNNATDHAQSWEEKAEQLTFEFIDAKFHNQREEAAE